MSLQEQMRALYLLDQEVRGLRSRLDAAIRRQQAQQNKLEQHQRQYAELEEQIRLGQAKAGALELQVKAAEDKIAKLREQMNTVKSNKEYSALLVEVNTLKLDKSKLEDEALARMGEVDALKQHLEQVEEKIQQQQKLVDLAAAEVASARAEVGQRLEEVTAQRDAAADQVPQEARALFNRLAQNYEGEAMAPVEEADRRRMEYNCGGCYMSLPIERVNALMMKPDDLVTCPNCGRILYLDQELKSAINSK